MAPSREELEQTKLQEEIGEIHARSRWQAQKAEAETKQIERAWFRTPSVLTSLVPIVLAVVGLIYSWSTGWFDNQKKALEARNSELEARNSLLEAKRTLIEDQTLRLGADKAALTDEKIRVEVKIAEATKALADLQSEDARLIEQNATLRNERDGLQGEKQELRLLVDQLNENLGVKDIDLLAAHNERDLAVRRDAERDRHAPIDRDIEILRTTLSSAMDAPAKELMNTPIYPDGGRDYVLDCVTKSAFDDSISEPRRMCFLAILYSLSKRGDIMDAMLAMPSLRTTELHSTYSFCEVTEREDAWRLFDIVTREKTPDLIGLSVLLSKVPGGWAQKYTPAQHQVMVRAIEIGRTRVLHPVALFDIEYGVQLVAKFSPFLAASALLQAYDESSNDETKLALTTSAMQKLRSSLMVGPDYWLQPTRGELQSITSLRLWLDSQDERIVGAALAGAVGSLFSDPIAPRLFIYKGPQ